MTQTTIGDITPDFNLSEASLATACISSTSWQLNDEIHLLRSVLQTPDLSQQVITYVNQKLLFKLKSRFGDELSQLAPELREAAESFKAFTGTHASDCTCEQCTTRF